MDVWMITSLLCLLPCSIYLARWVWPTSPKDDGGHYAEYRAIVARSHRINLCRLARGQ
jgi:hypothetical protein